MPGDAQGTIKSYIMPPAPSSWRPMGTPVAPVSSIHAPRSCRERHKMVVMLEAAGWRPKEIAQAMGYTPSRISIILKSQHPELQAVRRLSQAKVLDTTTDLLLRFREEAPKSLDALIQVRDNAEDLSQKRLAARDILDRAGYSVVKKAINLNANVPPQALEGAYEKILEAHEVDGMSDKWVVKNPQEKKDAA